MGVVASTSPYFAHLREFLSNARRALVRARLCVCVTRTMGLAKYEKKRLLETASSSTCRAHELLLTSDSRRYFLFFLFFCFFWQFNLSLNYFLSYLLLALEVT